MSSFPGGPARILPGRDMRGKSFFLNRNGGENIKTEMIFYIIGSLKSVIPYVKQCQNHACEDYCNYAADNNIYRDIG